MKTSANAGAPCTVQSDARWFPPVERRYWLPGFWTANLRAIGWEVLVLSPLVAFALWARQFGSADRVRTPRRARRRVTNGEDGVRSHRQVDARRRIDK